jgi:hypothetical protein
VEAAAGAQAQPEPGHVDDGTGQPPTGQPPTGQPPTGQPLAAEPAAGDPAAGQPPAVAPLAGKPPAVAPLAGSPSTAEPGPLWPGPRRLGPDHAGPGQPGPDQPRPDRLGPDYPGFDQSDPDHARTATRWRVVVVLSAVAALLLVFDVLWYVRYRSESQVVSRNFPVHGGARNISDDASSELLAAAKQAAARYLSYNYAHIQQDKAAAASVMTGSFRDQYTESMEMTIIPVALQVKAVVVGQTLTAGVSSINDDATQGVVIAFVNETVTNTKIKGARVDLVRLRLTMDKVRGDWLISKVESI